MSKLFFRNQHTGFSKSQKNKSIEWLIQSIEFFTDLKTSLSI